MSPVFVPARDALRSIEKAGQGVRREEDRLLALLASTEAEAERVRKVQADGFRDLARLRLDAITREETVGRLEGAEKRALEALARRRERLGEVARRRERLVAEAEAAEDRREEAAAARDAAVDAIEDLTERVAAEAARDPAWQAADVAARDLAAMASAAADKARQAAADRDAKRVPYEADPLFMYLWRSGYGTPDYRAGPVTRHFDGKVARLVGFDRARADYFMLNEIPVRLEQHAARLAEAAAASEAKREAVERAALEAAGIEPLEAVLAEREARLAAASSALEEVRASLGGLDTETRGLIDDASDPDIRAALDDLAAAIARDDLRRLYRAALDTPTPEDEAIVKGLQEAERQVVRITAQMEELRAAAVDLARKRMELERSEQTFRTKGYDDPFGGFADGMVIGRVIEGILRGAMSSRNLDDVLGKEYRRRTPRSGGFPGGFGGGFGGSRPSGGFRTGGRTGGGGFRTGGSF